MTNLVNGICFSYLYHYLGLFVDTFCSLPIKHQSGIKTDFKDNFKWNAPIGPVRAMTFITTDTDHSGIL